MPNETTTTTVPVPVPVPSRKFGVELEVFGNTTTFIQKARELGIQVENQMDRHSSDGYSWRIVYDSSLSRSNPTQGTGFEVVSPVLEGENGLEECRKICRALVRSGASVNRTCGFHVHVDARDLTVGDCKNVAIRYNTYEGILDQFVPLSRRGLSAYACAGTITPSELTSIQDKRTFRDLTRYRKVNLAAIHKHGTIEFRHAAGTINAEKVTMWVRWCLEFTEASRIPVATPATPTVPSTRRIPKREQLRRLAQWWRDQNLHYRWTRSSFEVGRAAIYLGISAPAVRTYWSLLLRQLPADRSGEYLSTQTRIERFLAEAPPPPREDRVVWGPRMVEKLRKVAECFLSQEALGQFRPQTLESIAQATGLSRGSIPGYLYRLRQLLQVRIRPHYRGGMWWSVSYGDQDTVKGFVLGTLSATWLEERIRACGTTRPPAVPVTPPTGVAPLPAEETWYKGVSLDVVQWLLERAEDLNQSPGVSPSIPRPLTLAQRA